MEKNVLMQVNCRSLATVRLLPAAKEELEAIASTNEKNIEEQKRGED